MNFIINIFFIFVATNILYYLINKDRIKRKKTTILLVILLIVLLIVSIFTYQFNICGTLQFMYEIICFGILLNTIYDNHKELSLKIVLNKKEKCIIGVAFTFGLACLLSISISNFRYILPFNEYGVIGNVYFNADVHRGATELLTYNVITHKIHPLYRFIYLPITLPIMLLNILVSKLGINSWNILVMNGYIITTIQLVFNSVSALVIYKILKQTKIKQNLCMIGTMLFIFSLAFIWLSILPETYSITLLTMLLMIYYYIANKKAWILFAALAIGSNLMSILPIGIIILDILIKNKKNFPIKHKYKILLIVCSLIIISIPMMAYAYTYILNWSDNLLTIGEKLYDSINKVLLPIILGPNFVNINPFFVQTKEINVVGVFLFVILLINSSIGYIVNRKKNFLLNICLIQLLVGYILHVIVGYGINNGIIYAPLYSWAFIILVTCGFQCLYENKKHIISFIVALVLLVAVYNIVWLFEFKNTVSKQEFSIPKYIPNVQVELLYSYGEAEKFYIINKSIIQLSTGKKLISYIDSYVYDKQNNTISGTLVNGKWFEIYTMEDKLIVNISEQISEIEEDKFFIFGMGLRDKYLFVKSSENEKHYKLIRYSDKKEILNNLILENIDYENYVIHVKNGNDEEVVIYENENGIYISKNEKITILEDDIKIKIPSFDGYEHKKQLKILLNEIMVNITKDGIKPNFIAYENSWYRDSSIVAMALQETDNLSQIEEWIKNIKEIYDMQNGYKEADNLGQVLYLISLVDDKNEKLIDEIIKEAEKLKNEEGYINGLTDGEYHPIYQTKWLIYGLKSLNLEYKDWNLPKIYDSYESLIWFDKEDKEKKPKILDRWPYLFFANMHYNSIRVEMEELNYPISSEYSPSQANFNKLAIINNNFADSKLVTPHAWSAAEMFLYLLDLDKGNI